MKGLQISRVGQNKIGEMTRGPTQVKEAEAEIGKKYYAVTLVLNGHDLLAFIMNSGGERMMGRGMQAFLFVPASVSCMSVPIVMPPIRLG